MKSVKDSILDNKKQAEKIIQETKDQLARIDSDPRLTIEGKKAARSELIKDSQAQVAELTKGLPERAEAAFQRAQAVAKEAQVKQQAQDRQKAEILLPLIQGLDESALIQLYEKKADDATVRTMIEDSLDLRFTIKLESAEKQTLIDKWNKAQERAREKNLPDENSQILAAGSLRDYAEKSFQVLNLELADLEGRPLTLEEKVIKRRLEHEASKFENAYSKV